MSVVIEAQAACPAGRLLLLPKAVQVVVRHLAAVGGLPRPHMHPANRRRILDSRAADRDHLESLAHPDARLRRGRSAQMTSTAELVHDP